MPKQIWSGNRSSVLLCTLMALCGCGDTEPQRRAAHAVGYADTRYQDTERDRPLQVRLWYPAAVAADAPSISYDLAFEGRAWHNAAFIDDRSRHSLILLSHGDKGSHVDQSWVAEALAAEGHIVAAVAHWQNTWRQNTPEASLRAWERPRDLSFLISSLLADPTWGRRIHPERIGAAGHSSGGYAVLALAGAIYDPRRMRDYCAGPTEGLDCRLGRGINTDAIDFSPAGASYRDERVKAVFAMAPALGPGITEASLRAIDIPVKIVASEDDEFLPIERHATAYAGHIPGSRLLRLPAGGHFVFMPECTFMGWAFLFFHDYDICGRRMKLDRADMHRQIAQDAVQFFNRSMAGEGTASAITH